MLEKKSSKESLMLKFIERNKEAIQNPIIESFLENDKNYELLQKAITNPTDENKREIDNAFKEHYKKIKKIKYISNLIRYFSIDYDKKIKKLNKRFSLTLDKEVLEEGNTTYKDLIETKPLYSEQEAYGKKLKDHIENDKLYQALNALTKKQLEILELKYLKEMSINEIAELIGTTSQNISNQHNKALKKLYKIIGSSDNGSESN
ncbi:sigma-70 family RNA polymerase sigma factor [Gracilibacillus thailandensis]|uniref:Sigma-70 family RNA polymerase sigma factor n=1 Tax=Gracilibacillus thailandensis TaxID=563735 RepID=A0A6N7QXB4_9BACI|nr:sigma-70 family RNA polymerase sigma factor [Gracilibacillus thailandensis]MRI66204.1 sigma-70 family RNA polymerase sigma factor [Gracilibacillus thailandensis]